MLQTKIFKMGKGDFLRQMIFLYGTPWIICGTSILILCGTLSYIHDIRWIIIGLMILFLLFPMATFFFYIYHGFRPVTVINTIPHSLEFKEDCIEATLFAIVNPESEGKERYKEISKKCIPYSFIKNYRCGLSSISIPSIEIEKGFLWVPLKAFEQERLMTDVSLRLSEGIQKNKHNLETPSHIITK